MKLRGKAKAHARRQARQRPPRVHGTLALQDEAPDLSWDHFPLTADAWNRYRRWLGEAETGAPVPVATCLRVYRETAHDPTGPSDYTRRSTLASDPALEFVVTMALSHYEAVPEVAALLAWEDHQGRCPCLRCAPEVLPAPPVPPSGAEVG